MGRRSPGGSTSTRERTQGRSTSRPRCASSTESTAAHSLFRSSSDFKDGLRWSPVTSAVGLWRGGCQCLVCGPDSTRQPRGGPRHDSQNSRGNATSSAGARRSIRSRTRSADSSTGRSTVGCSGGSGSTGGLGAGAWRSSSQRRARPGNLGNDGDQGPFPSQRSRLTDRTSMDGRRY